MTQATQYWIGTLFGVNFSIQIKGSAAKELKRLAIRERTRVVAAIDKLAENPFLGNALKGDLRGLRRIRVGNHRVLYEVQEQALIVLVVRVADRREAYRRMS